MTGLRLVSKFIIPVSEEGFPLAYKYSITPHITSHSLPIHAKICIGSQANLSNLLPRGRDTFSERSYLVHTDNQSLPWPHQLQVLTKSCTGPLLRGSKQCCHQGTEFLKKNQQQLKCIKHNFLRFDSLQSMLEEKT